MATDYYNSVNEWLEAGSPLGEPFLIMREHTMSIEDIDEGSTLIMLRALCTLIVRSLARYRDELGGSGYHIEPASSVFQDTWSFDYENETFGVCAEPAVISDRPRARISVGAIATILS